MEERATECGFKQVVLDVEPERCWCHNLALNERRNMELTALSRLGFGEDGTLASLLRLPLC